MSLSLFLDHFEYSGIKIPNFVHGNKAASLSKQQKTGK